MADFKNGKTVLNLGGDIFCLTAIDIEKGDIERAKIMVGF